MTDLSIGVDSRATVLVTGAHGFIGTTLMKLAECADGPRFVGVDKKDADLCDEGAVAQLLDRVRPNRIVHLAGALKRGERRSEVQKQVENTFLAGTHIINCAVELGIPHIIIAGTIDELGNQEGALDPATPTAPRSAYGLSKCLLREYADYWVRHAALRVDWFRPFIVYGPGQTGGQMLLPTAFRSAKSGQRAQFSDGKQRRDFIHVEDVASWILRAVRVNLGNQGGLLKIHHLGTGEAVEVRTVLQTIAQEFPGSQFEIGGIARRLGEPPIEVSTEYSSDEPPLDTWRPQYNWREGIAHTCAWWRTFQPT